MTIPFLDLFKKAKARFGKQPEAPRPMIVRPPLAEKSAAERLSKTVLPNTTRTVAPVDTFRSAAGPTGSKVRLRESSGALVKPPAERTISLTLGDLLQHLPQASIKPTETLDVNRTISIKAAEVEKGMATGEPTAMLCSIYEQAPDIFRQSVPPTDLTAITLPLDKVLQQFQALQVRADQMLDEAVPQVETPFLQVTIEDTKKFGTNLAPLQTSAKPPVKVEPATARAIAKAEPEPVAQEKQTPNISSRRPISAKPKTESVSPPPAEAAAPPTRIPFKLPPNGAGVPASERVPASSGPPVPTSPPTPSASSKPAAPVRIPFKMTPPNAELKPKLTLVPGIDPVKSEPPPAQPPAVTAAIESTKPEGEKIKLRLNVCFRNLPAFQLSGELPEISEDVMIELPFSIIEPQLASGRIAVNPKLFHSAIPEQFRSVFVVDATETPVLLPLQEVLQHLPTSALQMRHDQEHEEAIEHFETPFSLQAKEDQKRFGKPDAEAAKAPEAATAKILPTPPGEPAKVEVAAPIETPKETTPSKESNEPDKGAEDKPESASPATREKKRTIEAPALLIPATKDAEAKSNAKEIVIRVSCLPGVAGCSIAFADGLTMAGNLPPNLGADGLCAVAPSVLQKIQKHMPETDLGSLNSMTLNCSKSPMSFFMEGNICLTVLHSEQTLEAVTQEQLVEMTKELAQIFAQPEITHVDH